MAKSKVKSYARRTKKGLARVTGHDRDNKRKRNRNIALAAGGLTALGLAGAVALKSKAKKSAKPKIDIDGMTKNLDDFVRNPSPSPSVKETTENIVATAKKIKSDSPSVNTTPPASKPTSKAVSKKAKQPETETPSTTVEEIRQTTQDVVDKSKKLKVESDKNLTKKQAPKNKKSKNEKVEEAKKILEEAQYRKSHAERYAAKDLRSRNIYPNNPKPKTKKTNKLLDETLTGKNYSSKPKNTTPNIFDRVERLRKWDANRGVVIRRKKLLEESLGQKLVDKTKGRLDFNPTPKSRKARKKAAKQVAAEAKRLRDLGEYY